MLQAILPGDRFVEVVSVSDPTGRSDRRIPLPGYEYLVATRREPTPTDVQAATQEAVEKVSE